MMQRHTFLVAFFSLVLTSSAHAAMVTKSFAFTGSDFTLSFGNASTLPIDPAYISGSVTFDDAIDHISETAGLSFASNLPYTARFGYTAASDQFTLATFPGLNGCSEPSGSFCTFFNGFSALQNPLPYFFQQTTLTGGFYRAQSITAGAPVSTPEPSTWALLTIGFGAIGAALRLRSKERVVYA